MRLFYPVRSVNEFGIRLLPEGLRSALFRSSSEKTVSAEKLKQAHADLAKFELGKKSETNSGSESDSFPHVELPKLYGDVEAHFMKIGQDQIQPYLNLLNDFFTQGFNIKKPREWQFVEGWMRYDPSGKVESVQAPLEDCFSFDVEVCVQDGNHPIMATALSSKAWYSWTSPHLIHGTKPPDGSRLSLSDLIPITLDPSCPRIVIGHNVCFDRARCREEYQLKLDETRFLDTMSMHIVVSGMSSEQRMLKVSKNHFVDGNRPRWYNETSLNNLNDTYQLYCKGAKPLAKMKRDVFVTGTLEDIRTDFQNLMTYCSNDVLATSMLSKQLFPLFRERCPHPVTLAGMLELSKCYLPISQRWQHYIKNADDLYNEIDEDTEQVLVRLAKEACQLIHQNKYKNDFWMWDQDWEVKGLRMKGKSAQKIFLSEKMDKKDLFKTLSDTVKKLYKVQPRWPGYPKWVQELCSKPANPWETGNFEDFTSSKKVVPKLLQLSWMNYALHRHETHKWGYIVPDNEDDSLDSEVSDEAVEFPSKKYRQEMCSNFEDNFEDETSSMDFEDVNFEPKGGGPKIAKQNDTQVPDEVKKEAFRLPEIPGCLFVRLPHKDGKANNVGNPLAKDFLNKVNDGILKAQSSSLASKVLSSGKVTSYWRSNRERITSQLVVGFNANNNNNAMHHVILPQLVPAGTLTRRAVERTWLTASNVKSDRLGSELKTLVEAPSGYRFVKADVDSQELWIAAVIGDAHFCKEHGSTPLGWMTLQGKKSEGTDMHSMVAKTAGVSRDNAKILNYGRIYGAGLSFAKQLLQKFNPKLTDQEAKASAAKMYLQTKGERMYILNKMGAICFAATFDQDSPNQWKGLIGKTVTKKEMNRIVKMKRILDTMFKKSKSSGEWMVKDNNAEYILIEMGFDINTDEPLKFEDVFKAIRQARRLRLRTDDVDDWVYAVSQVSSGTNWHGGTESHSFNRLEEIASNSNAKTPVLGCRITRALESTVVGQDYMPSRVNWVVQSSAVDYLHLLLVAMRWLMKDFDIAGRLVISIHDEVCFMIEEESCYRGALALQIANLLVRAIFCSRLGMSNLPENVAYFSTVDIDRVLRKDPDSECKTPSNPQGLTSYGVPKGEALTVEQIMNITGPSLSKLTKSSEEIKIS